MRMVLLPLVAGLAACAQTPADHARAAQDQAAQQQKLAAALAGLTPGEPTTCISQTQTSNTSVAAYGSTLVYTISPRLKYRNDTSGGCERVGDDDILVTSTPTAELCRGDIGRTVDRNSRFPSGSCSFGAFVPYRR